MQEDYLTPQTEEDWAYYEAHQEQEQRDYEEANERPQPEEF